MKVGIPRRTILPLILRIRQLLINTRDGTTIGYRSWIRSLGTQSLVNSPLPLSLEVKCLTVNTVMWKLRASGARTTRYNLIRITRKRLSTLLIRVEYCCGPPPTLASFLALTYIREGNGIAKDRPLIRDNVKKYGILRATITIKRKKNNEV